jgi:hypothetical protein
MRRLALTLTIMCLPLLAESLSAQEAAHDGDRVRVTWLSPNSHFGAENEIGTLTFLTPDSIIITTEEENVRIPLREILRVAGSRGMKTRTGKGALIGAFVGAAGGGFTALLACSTGCRSSGGDFEGIVAAGLVGSGALVGSGIGAIIGSVIHREAWKPVSLDGLRIGITPATSGMTVLSMQISLPRLR